MKEPTMEKESAETFKQRVLERTGLNIEEIPDGTEKDMLSGQIILSSPYGKVVYLEPTGEEDEDGNTIYSKAVVVQRSNDLPKANTDATGEIKD